jgi:hypothetical protein
MEERFDNIDLLYRENFSEFAPDVPDGMWERIADKLPAKKSRVVPLIWKIAAGMAILIATGSMITYFVFVKQVQVQVSVNTSADKNISPTVFKEAPAKKNIQTNLTSSKKDIQSVRKVEALNSSNKLEDFPSDPGDKTVEGNPKNNSEQVEAIINEPVFSSIDSESPSNTIAEIKNENSVLEQNQISIENSNKIIAENIADLEANKEDDHQRKWLIGGQGGPQYSYRSIASKNIEASTLQEKNQTETGIIAYAGGVNIAMQPAKRFSIESGIYYSKIGMEQVASRNMQSSIVEPADQPDSWNDNYATSSVSYTFPNSSAKIERVSVSANTNKISQPEGVDYGVYENTSQEFLQAKRYYEYLEIPLIAKYALLDKKFGIHVLGGFSTNILVNNAVLIADPDYGTKKTKTLENKNFSFSSTFGFGLSYSISARINMSLEPQFKYFLTKQTSDPNIDVNPYSLGVFTGVKYLF